MPYVIQAGDLDIFVTDLLAPGDPSIEAEHLARLLGYTQKHSVRKQILTGWKDIFEEGRDYVLAHDPKQLEVYQMSWASHLGTPLKPVKPERGRMFIRPIGVKKVLIRSTKTSSRLEKALDSFMNLEAAPVPAPAPSREEGQLPKGGRVVGSIKGVRSSAAPEPPKTEWERQRQYKVLETLLDHLKNIEDPALKRLAILSAEVGIGHTLEDVRKLFLEEETPPAAPAPPAPAPSSPAPVEAPANDDGAARDYLAKHPVTQNAPFFQGGSTAYFSFKQIGEKAGGYSAVQAGKAADLVAKELGLSHDDIRKKQLDFNLLVDRPDTTTGKLRQMYQFNARFSNNVIRELRRNPAFTPGTPADLTPFHQGGDLPKLSQGPFDEH